MAVSTVLCLTFAYQIRYADTTFFLEPGSYKFVTIKSGPFAFSKASIALGDQPLLESTMLRELGKGGTLPLPDGSSLAVKNVAGGLGKSGGLEVLRNGVPLPGSVGTPEHALRTAKGAGQLLYCLASLNVLYGLVVQYSGTDSIFSWNADGCWPYLLSALFVAVLGLLVHKKHSLVALGIALAYPVGDAVATFSLQLAAGARLESRCGSSLP